MEMIYTEEERIVNVKEEFSSSKSKLEDIIREFDEKIRTKFSGCYTITISSPYLTTESISYSYKNGDEKDGLFSTNSHVPTVEIHDTISVPRLTFTESV